MFPLVVGDNAAVIGWYQTPGDARRKNGENTMSKTQRQLVITILAVADETVTETGDWTGQAVNNAFIKSYLDGAYADGSVTLVPGIVIDSIIVADA